MAYPPSIPAGDITNNTPQVDRHPADHNGITNALRDILNELGTDPSGSYATVMARLNSLPRGPVANPVIIATDQAITTTTATLSGYATTFTAVAGRLYEAVWSIQFSHEATNNITLRAMFDGAPVTIANYGTVTAGSWSMSMGSVQFSCGTQLGNLPGIAAGTRTVSLAAYCGPGTAYSRGATVTWGRWCISDIGAII